MTPWQFVPGVGDVLTIVDHASNHVPSGIDLQIDPALLETHIAWDIGAAALAKVLGYPAFLATVSRLVIDFNREENANGLIPIESDGVAIPGNLTDQKSRIDNYWWPYHDKLGQLISDMKPKLLVSLHSFTPSLSSEATKRRPWQLGILYNNDDRAARIAIPLLESERLNVGDQLPYSGKVLNATMNRHGEGTGTPYLGIEVRQDLIADDAGVARMAKLLLPAIKKSAKLSGVC